MSGTTLGWAWHHSGLAVTSIEKAVNFYRKTLGFEVVFEARGMTDLISGLTGVPGLRADLVQCKSPMSDQVLEFIEFKNIPKDFNARLPITPGRAHVAFLVPNIEIAVEALLSAGGTQFGKTMEFAEGKAAYCADESGTVVELEEATGEQHS